MFKEKRKKIPKIRTVQPLVISSQCSSRKGRFLNLGSNAVCQVSEGCHLFSRSLWLQLSVSWVLGQTVRSSVWTGTQARVGFSCTELMRGDWSEAPCVLPPTQMPGCKGLSLAFPCNALPTSCLGSSGTLLSLLLGILDYAPVAPWNPTLWGFQPPPWSCQLLLHTQQKLTGLLGEGVHSSHGAPKASLICPPAIPVIHGKAGGQAGASYLGAGNANI